jgi:hypothetical protein
MVLAEGAMLHRKAIFKYNLSRRFIRFLQGSILSTQEPYLRLIIPSYLATAQLSEVQDL